MRAVFFVLAFIVLCLPVPTKAGVLCTGFSDSEFMIIEIDKGSFDQYELKLNGETQEDYRCIDQGILESYEGIVRCVNFDSHIIDVYSLLDEPGDGLLGYENYQKNLLRCRER